MKQKVTDAAVPVCPAQRSTPGRGWRGPQNSVPCRAERLREQRALGTAGSGHRAPTAAPAAPAAREQQDPGGKDATPLAGMLKPFL